MSLPIGALVFGVRYFAPLSLTGKAVATFIGTPKGKNEFWELWQIANKSDAWFKLELKASETGLIPAEELDAAREAMTKDQYAQEFECSFDARIHRRLLRRRTRAHEGREANYQAAD